MYYNADIAKLVCKQIPSQTQLGNYSKALPCWTVSSSIWRHQWVQEIHWCGNKILSLLICFDL